MMNTPFWVWAWRRLHCANKMQFINEEAQIDTGYCLDRYSIEHEPGVFIRVIP